MRTTVLLATVLVVACNTGSVSSRSATRIQDTVRVQIQTDGNPAATIREAVLAHGNVCEGVEIAEREYAEQIRLGASSDLYNSANAQAIAETLAQLRDEFGCNNRSDGGVSGDSGRSDAGTTDAPATPTTGFRVVGGIGPGEPNVHGNRTFGSNAALSSDGTVMAVADSTAGSNGRGAIWVFRRSSASATWPSPVRIDATDTYQLGSTVALSARGDTLMGCATGGAFAVIYNYVAGSWSQSAIVRPPSGASSSFARSSAFSADGNTLVLGDQGGGGDGQGAVAVYLRQNGVWGVPSLLPRPAGALNFGERIQISGDANLIVTSHSVSTSAAVISVFRRSGGSPIVLRHSAIPYPTAIALSADGMTLVAGDSTNNAAVVFGRTVTGVWTEGRVLTTPTERRGFGTGVSVSANGSVVAVGDQYVDAGAGRIHTFMRTGSTITASWSAPTTLIRHAGAQVIGHSIVMDADARTLVIPDFQAGEVWMYAR